MGQKRNSGSDDKQGTQDRNEILDARLLDSAGWFPEQTEVVSGGATGSGYSAFDMRTPFLDLLKKDPKTVEEMKEEGLLEALREMGAGLRAGLREILGDPAKDPDVVSVGLNAMVFAYYLEMPPFDKMTLDEIGKKAGEGRAAISARLKRLITKKLEEAEFRGTRCTRQKRSGLVAIYKARAAGNSNRADSAGRDRLHRTFRPTRAGA